MSWAETGSSRVKYGMSLYSYRRGSFSLCSEGNEDFEEREPGKKSPGSWDE